MIGLLATVSPWWLFTLLMTGLVIGRLANVAALRLQIAFWAGEPAVALARRNYGWWYLPVLGWLLAPVELPDGRRQRIRPLLVELASGLALVALYVWEVERLGLLGADPWAIGPVAEELRRGAQPTFAAHAVLGALMLVATLIDLDERIIPDQITVPGTLLGLLMAALWPAVLLPTGVSLSPDGRVVVERLHLAAPGPWPPFWHEAPAAGGLLVALACYAAWCFALLPRRWNSRGGVGPAVRRFVRRIVRDGTSRWIAGLGLLGTAGIVATWLIGGPHWMGLATALVGMAAGGGIVWAVRLIGAAALKREAMGFGDVTLLAMIGSVVGWQNCLIVFFLAPATALVLGLAQWLLRREHEIPYGPFLCLTTALVLANWQFVWREVEPYFAVSWLVPSVVALCLVLMLVLLTGMRAVRSALGG